MSLIPSETPAEVLTPAQKIAKGLVGALGSAKAQLLATRRQAAATLWKSQTHDTDPETGKPVVVINPTSVVAELSAKEARAVMVTDLLQRVNLAYTETVHVAPENRVAAMVQAFQALSPVPSTHEVHLKDGAGATVDPTAEVVALLAKLAQAEAVQIVAKPVSP